MAYDSVLGGSRALAHETQTRDHDCQASGSFRRRAFLPIAGEILCANAFIDGLRRRTRFDVRTQRLEGGPHRVRIRLETLIERDEIRIGIANDTWHGGKRGAKGREHTAAPDERIAQSSGGSREIRAQQRKQSILPANLAQESLW